MTNDPGAGLSAREREVMDIIHRLREASATDVEREMEQAPSNATVRSILRGLEEKEQLVHRRDGARYVYRPSQSRERVRKRALSHLVSTFFDGSPSEAVAALVGRGKRLSAKERDRLKALLKALEEENS